MKAVVLFVVRELWLPLCLTRRFLKKNDMEIWKLKNWVFSNFFALVGLLAMKGQKFLRRNVLLDLSKELPFLQNLK